MKKHIISFITLLTLVFITISGCGKEENDDKEKETQKIYGGDMLKYSICLEGDKEQIVSCPIITNIKADSIKLNNVTTGQSEALSVTMSSVDMNDTVEYNGYYIYFALLSISGKDKETAVNTDITKVLFEIDGKLFSYETPCFKVRNTKYYEKNEGYTADSGKLLISGDFSGVYGYIPEKEKKTGLTVMGTEDLTIKSYLLNDYISINNLTVNGKTPDFDAINFSAEKEQDIIMEYNIKLQEGVKEDDIIRVSQCLFYEAGGEKYIWVYTSGVYIWKDYSDYGNIKRYIDKLQTQKQS